jgi:DNA-binding IclR family transcriptional regulator
MPPDRRRTDRTVPLTRRLLLECLAELSDADGCDTTDIETLCARLGTDEETLHTHLDPLMDCELARRCGDGDVRITVTGEELLELDTEDPIVVDLPTADG